MSEKSNMPIGNPFNLEKFIDYAKDSVISKTIFKREIGNLTLFSFDQGQGLSEHTAPYDAIVYVLDGQAQIIIGGKPCDVSKGEMLVMPANISHALKATKPFKMLLTMIRGN